VHCTGLGLCLVGCVGTRNRRFSPHCGRRLRQIEVTGTFFLSSGYTKSPTCAWFSLFPPPAPLEFRLTPANEGRLDPAIVAGLYLKHGDELRRFLVGLLRDHDLAGDVMQVAFARAIEVGHTAQAES